MTFTQLPLKGLLLIKPKILSDERGYFFESYHKMIFEEAGLKIDFIQDNESCSSKNVLRGLHFQTPPFEQGKLVRVIKGAALDVMVDIRQQSKTFGKHFKIILDDKQKNMLWIPPGFAHGFVSLADDTVFVYKCTNVYNRDSEKGINWSDPDLNIDWEINQPLISSKDTKLSFLKDIEFVF